MATGTQVAAASPGSRVQTAVSGIIAQVVTNPDGTPISNGGTGTVRTAAVTVATGNGSVTAGKKSVSINSSSDFSGTVTGAALPASGVVTFAADGADTIGAIAYTISAGSLTIATLT